MAFHSFKHTLLLSLSIVFALASFVVSPGRIARVQAAPEYYTVTRGDTLSSIAARFDVSMLKLLQANNIAAADFLQVGQLLVIPGDGQPAMDQAAELITDFRIYVPYRTQFDGTRYEGGNCGPATLGMALAYFGDWVSTDDLRRLVNQSTGDWSVDGGSDWRSLVFAMQAQGFSAVGPYDGPNVYHTWTLDEVLQQVEQGRPTLLLVRYPYLPGHEGGWPGDHYVLVLGRTADGKIVYHDSAFNGNSTGAYRTMSVPQLMRAWQQTQEGISYSAMALERTAVDVIRNAE